MKNLILTALFISVSMLLACQPKVEAPIERQTFVVENAWVRAMPPGRRMTAAYGELKNVGTVELRVNKFSSPQFSSVSLHETILDSSGMSHMQEIHELILQPGEIVILEPGGKHLMLMGMRDNKTETSSAAVIIKFEFEDPVSVEFSLRNL
ncbi:MAG: copper chaperone PCu(A)C [Proteobacteria bacterium]|nr:copper chaperone PCu(A)C [Pseudomonadota bacterium]